MQITQRHAELCSGLGDFHRILILYALAERPHNVSELAARLGSSQPTISRQLKTLRECGAVSAERQGKAVYYRPADGRIISAMDTLRAVVTDQIRTQVTIVSVASNRPLV